MIEKLARKLKDAVCARGVSVAAAESCTGGCVSGAITESPGSSVFFKGAVVSYSNGVKEKTLGVPRSVLEQFGAVSSECAAAMAQGARALLNADFAVSVTGIAGPDGGSPLKPVGTVWFGLCGPHGVSTQMKRFEGGRADVRRQSVENALLLLIGAVEGLSDE